MAIYLLVEPVPVAVRSQNTWSQNVGKFIKLSKIPGDNHAVECTPFVQNLNSEFSRRHLNLHRVQEFNQIILDDGTTRECFWPVRHAARIPKRLDLETARLLLVVSYTYWHSPKGSIFYNFHSTYFHTNRRESQPAVFRESCSRKNPSYVVDGIQRGNLLQRKRLSSIFGIYRTSRGRH